MALKVIKNVFNLIYCRKLTHDLHFSIILYYFTNNTFYEFTIFRKKYLRTNGFHVLRITLMF